MHDAVMARDYQRKFAVVAWQFESVTQRLEECDAALLVSAVTRPLCARGGSLAEVMNQRRKSHACVGRQCRGLIQHHERMNAGIDLRMPLRGLRNAEQRVDFGVDASKRAAFAQHLEEGDRKS